MNASGGRQPEWHKYLAVLLYKFRDVLPSDVTITVDDIYAMGGSGQLLEAREDASGIHFTLSGVPPKPRLVAVNINPPNTIGIVWPLVDPHDDGIRPAGEPDACFYCQQKVGTEHKRNCVIVEKLVRLRYSIDVDVEIPYSWDKNMVEFHRNESSWCANNAVDQIQAQVEASDKDGRCLCDRFTATLVCELDVIPRRKVKE